MENRGASQKPARSLKSPKAAGLAKKTKRSTPESLARQRASRRPRVNAEGQDDAGGRLFVSALARGFEVLGAFRSRDVALGNLELAERTGLPKATISRITHTLTQLGYLAYNPKLSNYELGGRLLALGYVAISNLDILRVARPIMQKLANSAGVAVTLGTRDKLMLLNVETSESRALIGLRLPPGSRMPIVTTASGRGYLAAVSEEERNGILDAVAKQHGDEWPTVRRAVERSIRDVADRGFCVSVGEWQKDINGAGAPVRAPGAMSAYGIAIGGPAYLLPEEQLIELGPLLAKAADEITGALGGHLLE
jgi:DNA-binding IclR family transcriptional regulator